MASAILHKCALVVGEGEFTWIGRGEGIPFCFQLLFPTPLLLVSWEQPFLSATSSAGHSLCTSALIHKWGHEGFAKCSPVECDVVSLY